MVQSQSLYRQFADKASAPPIVSFMEFNRTGEKDDLEDVWFAGLGLEILAGRKARM